VRSFKVGTDRRIEKLYAKRYAAYCRLATTITGDVDVAHEAVQEGFARALAGSENFRGDGSLDSWLWRIVSRTALDMCRQGDDKTVFIDDAGTDESRLFVPELPHPERDHDLQLALLALTHQQRLLVFLRYFADMSHTEMAATTGLRPGTVSATLSQAKRILARRLEGTAHIAQEVAR
jgi:RNA polymerase sigma-70 factor (ECF subfamily)